VVNRIGGDSKLTACGFGGLEV
jgi:hypothetical protein